jgi:hypothetical protein
LSSPKCSGKTYPFGQVDATLDRSTETWYTTAYSCVLKKGFYVNVKKKLRQLEDEIDMLYQYVTANYHTHEDSDSPLSLRSEPNSPMAMYADYQDDDYAWTVGENRESAADRAEAQEEPVIVETAEQRRFRIYDNRDSDNQYGLDRADLQEAGKDLMIDRLTDQLGKLEVEIVNMKFKADERAMQHALEIQGYQTRLRALTGEIKETQVDAETKSGDDNI